MADWNWFTLLLIQRKMHVNNAVYVAKCWTIRLLSTATRPVFMHGPLEPGPRVANFQGRHIKKIETEVWYAEKKGCPRERNLREIYTVCLVVPKQEDDHFPSGIAGIV